MNWKLGIETNCFKYLGAVLYCVLVSAPVMTFDQHNVTVPLISYGQLVVEMSLRGVKLIT